MHMKLIVLALDCLKYCIYIYSNNYYYYHVLCSFTANLKLMFILTHSILDNYKDAIRLMTQYQNGCNTSELQSEAEQEGKLPEKRFSVYVLFLLCFYSNRKVISCSIQK